jgi:Spy/CpxP family protein refolding chaperone
MRLRTATLSLAAAIVLAAVPATYAVGRGAHGPAGDGADHILRMAKVLGLSDAQTSQIQAIIAKHKDANGGTGVQAMRDARKTLMNTIHDPSATDDQVRDAAATLAALESQGAVQKHQMMTEISAVLTPDQKAKLDELKASFMDRHAGPRQYGPDPSSN